MDSFPKYENRTYIDMSHKESPEVNRIIKEYNELKAKQDKETENRLNGSRYVSQVFLFSAVMIDIYFFKFAGIFLLVVGILAYFNARTVYGKLSFMYSEREIRREIIFSDVVSILFFSLEICITIFQSTIR